MAFGYVQLFVIRGQTFEYRKELGAAGASFIGTRRCWEMQPRPTQQERSLQLRLANQLVEAGLRVELETRPVTGDLLS